MSNSKPLAEQITTSIEDVKALLDSNRNLSVAYLSRRLRDMETEMRARFRGLEAKDGNAPLKEAVKKLNERVDLAGVKYKEMQEDVDKLREKLRTIQEARNA